MKVVQIIKREENIALTISLNAGAAAKEVELKMDFVITIVVRSVAENFLLQKDDIVQITLMLAHIAQREYRNMKNVAGNVSKYIENVNILVRKWLCFQKNIALLTKMIATMVVTFVIKE